MFKRSQFGIVFNTIFSLVFSAALTVFVKFMQGSLTFETFCTGLVVSFAINFMLGSFIPLLKVGNKFASCFIKSESNPLFYFLRMFAIVFIMTVFMSLLVMFSEMGFHPALLRVLFSTFPRTFLYAYIVACIVFPVLLIITQKLCSGE